MRTATNAGGYLKRLERLNEYEAAVARLFPPLPRLWSITVADALCLAHFLECYARRVVVLDVGTFVGMSAFFFATQPRVVRVISVDANPTIAKEIDDKPGAVDTGVDFELLRNLRPLQVAQSALAEFADERQKIELREGVVGSSQVSVQGSPSEDVEKIEVPVLELSKRLALVAFIDGLHTEEAVRADLEAVFERNPHALALLHDCRGAWGPYVQAGVAAFIETAQSEYRFQLFERWGPGLEPPNIGIVYPEADAAEVEHVLSEANSSLQLLKRSISLELQDPLPALRLTTTAGIRKALRTSRAVRALLGKASFA